MSRFQFVDNHRDAFGVKRLCEVLGLNRSSDYKWLTGMAARTARQREDQFLARKIRQVHGESGGAYGSPRVTAELRKSGLRVNEKRVARVMRTFALTGTRLRRRVRTTVPDPAASPVPDLFQQDFTATKPGGNTWAISPISRSRAGSSSILRPCWTASARSISGRWGSGNER